MDVKRILARIGDLTANIVLVGGQALNVWAETYASQDPALAEQGPFTSKDIDFQGDQQAVRLCADRLGGRPLVAQLDDHTVNTGVVLYVDDLGLERSIDFIDAPLGLKADEVRRLAIPFEVLDAKDQPTGMDFLVMHPIHCLESRVHNVMGLGHDTRKHLSQLRATIIVARHFLGYLLDEGHKRDVLRLNERIFWFCMTDLHGRDVAARYGVDPFEAILVDDRLERFVSERHPRMIAQLQRKRARRAAASRAVSPRPELGN